MACLQNRQIYDPSNLPTFLRVIQTQKRYPTSLDKIRILT